MKNPKDIIFSLDIGTRKVAGLLAAREAGLLRVVDLEIREHSGRSMLDGQVHNIEEVAEVVRQVKEALEKRSKIELKQVGVAVAGRTLRTRRARVEGEADFNEEITADSVRNLEMEALSLLMREENEAGADYYCVGYSVVRYELDGQLIGELRGHRGRSMAVELIATFLPRVVLNSMLSVLDRAGLEAVNLTLEPIAAMNVIIPQDIRRLNLLLLDIGAGTTDLALTREGAVFAYGMVPEAGDEITEFICEKYILDFASAEKLKRQIRETANISFRDIFGKPREITAEELKAEIRPRVRLLAESIVKEALALNGKVPHAVILVGGGSLTPGLEEEIAAILGLDRTHVGIRLPEAVAGVKDETGKLTGPEQVTPLGICVMSGRSEGLRFIDITLNSRPARIPDLQQNLDLLSVLVTCGVDRLKLYGRIGHALCVEVNKELKMIKGGMGRPARVRLNGQPAEFTASVNSGDRIDFEGARDGADARGRVGEVVDIQPLNLIFNDQPLRVEPRIMVNGFPADKETELTDRARIECGLPCCRDTLLARGIDPEAFREKEIMIRVNREPRVLTQTGFQLRVNGQRAGLDEPLSEGARIEFDPEQSEFFLVKEVVDIPGSGKNVKIRLNGEELVLQGSNGRIFLNGRAVSPDEPLVDRSEIVTRSGNDLPPTVSRVMDRVSVNPKDQKGKRLTILVNGEPAGFTTPLTDGAEVSVVFVDR